MKTLFDPRRFDVAAFCRADGHLAGDLPLSDFGRLSDGALPESGARRVRWQADGESPLAPGGARLVRLHLVAEVEVDLICQRCLEPMLAPLRIDRWFRFVGDEATAARLDEDSDDDILVMDRAFDLLALVEDELLLEWPSVPRHTDCRPPLAGEPVPPGRGDAPQRERPAAFADLARLRKRSPE